MVRGVEGHFDHPHGRDWMYIADNIHPHFAELVGQYVNSTDELSC